MIDVTKLSGTIGVEHIPVGQLMSYSLRNAKLSGVIPPDINYCSNSPWGGNLAPLAGNVDLLAKGYKASGSGDFFKWLVADGRPLVKW